MLHAGRQTLAWWTLLGCHRGEQCAGLAHAVPLCTCTLHLTLTITRYILTACAVSRVLYINPASHI